MQYGLRKGCRYIDAETQARAEAAERQWAAEQKGATAWGLGGAERQRIAAQAASVRQRAAQPAPVERERVNYDAQAKMIAEALANHPAIQAVRAQRVPTPAQPRAAQRPTPKNPALVAAFEQALEAQHKAVRLEDDPVARLRSLLQRW